MYATCWWPYRYRASRRKMLKALGRTPAQEIRRVRLAHACQLLTETGLPVADIAVRCGFRYRTYLAMTFKKTFGQSPDSIARKPSSIERPGLGKLSSRELQRSSHCRFKPAVGHEAFENHAEFRIRSHGIAHLGSPSGQRARWSRRLVRGDGGGGGLVVHLLVGVEEVAVDGSGFLLVLGEGGFLLGPDGGLDRAGLDEDDIDALGVQFDAQRSWRLPGRICSLNTGRRSGCPTLPRIELTMTIHAARFSRRHDALAEHREHRLRHGDGAEEVYFELLAPAGEGDELDRPPMPTPALLMSAVRPCRGEIADSVCRGGDGGGVGYV